MLGADVAARGAALAVRVPLGARQRRDRRAGGSGPSRARRRARRLGPLAPARGGRRGRGGRVPARGDPCLPRLPCRAPRAAPGAPGPYPAGIRMVKRPRFPLQPLERVVARRPSVRLLYVGPVLDADERDALHRALEGRPWARWIGPVPHAQMGSLLALGDVVLNCSISEGGMANSVLEALALGRAVLASDIEGNRSLIDDGVTGFLFRDEAEFERRAELLASDPALRARLGAAGRDLVERRYPATREIDGYLDVYRQLVPVSA